MAWYGVAWRGHALGGHGVKAAMAAPPQHAPYWAQRSAAHLILGGADGERVDLRSGPTGAGLRGLPTRSCCADRTRTKRCCIFTRAVAHYK